MATKPTDKKTTAKTTTAKAKTTTTKSATTAAAATAAKPAKTARAKKSTKTKDARPCRVTSCKREYRAKGYCKAHYKQWRQGKFGVARYKTCNDNSDCRKPMALNRHGYCEAHFQNYYVKGMEVTHAPKVEAPKKEEKVAANAG